MRARACCTSAATRRVFATLAVVVGLAAARAAPPLSADLLAHRIALGSDVAGRSITLFGTVDAPGDIVVVVRGPESPAVVRRGPFGDF